MPPWPLLVFLVIGATITFGGFSIYSDQRSGVPGRATVSECEGGRQYDRGIRCSGSWSVGGDAIFGDGQLSVGPVRGAGYGDVGKTIDVRIHTDHATKPALATPIVLWSLGAPICLLSLLALVGWARRRHDEMPPPVLEHVAGVVRQTWGDRDPEAVVASLPSALPAGSVHVLVSGGPFGWILEARLDVIAGRVALEVLEDSRMSGPFHYRVWEDGSLEQLANELTAHAVPDDPVQAERVVQEVLRPQPPGAGTAGRTWLSPPRGLTKAPTAGQSEGPFAGGLFCSDRPFHP